MTDVGLIPVHGDRPAHPGVDDQLQGAHSGCVGGDIEVVTHRPARGGAMTVSLVAANPMPQRRFSIGDPELCYRLAERTGLLLMRRRFGDGPVPAVAEARRGDAVAHRYLTRSLAGFRPEDAVLSEESVDASRLDSPRVWIVDPLDGSREYAERGRIDWAVHVALWSDGSLAEAAVALPATGLVHSTRNVRKVPDLCEGRPRIVVSRRRPSPLIKRIATAIDAEVILLGSAGFKAMSVVLGTADAYVHSGQYEWNSAAPLAVAAAAGLHTSRLDGAPLEYNQADPRLPDVLVCRRSLAEAIINGASMGGLT